MKKFLLTFLLLIPLIFNLACNESAITDHVNSSIVRITGTTQVHSIFGSGPANYVCTGFMVTDKIILTANHCLGGSMTGDGYPVDIIRGDKYYDLALLKTTNSKGILTFRDEPVIIGEEIIGVGYGNGWPLPIGVRVRVVAPALAPYNGVPVGIISQGSFIGGMSGGPMVDLGGRVVGVVQQQNDGLSYGIATTMIRAFLLDNGITLITSGGGIDWQN